MMTMTMMMMMLTMMITPHLTSTSRIASGRWVNYRAFCNEMQTPPDSIRSVLQDCFDRLRREFTSRGSVGLLGLLHSFRDYDRVGQGAFASQMLSFSNAHATGPPPKCTTLPNSHLHHT
eukprot:683097-Rhodomonas_salina.3